MTELLSNVVASIVCLFKRHNFKRHDQSPLGYYDYCVRCGKLEIHKGSPLP